MGEAHNNRVWEHRKAN